MSEKNELNNQKVRVFSTPTCPYCIKAKEFLKEKKISFESLDVSTNHDARNEMVEKSGQMGVPVIDVNGKFMVGFNKDALKELLKL